MKPTTGSCLMIIKHMDGLRGDMSKGCQLLIELVAFYFEKNYIVQMKSLFLLLV